MKASKTAGQPASNLERNRKIIGATAKQANKVYESTRNNTDKQASNENRRKKKADQRTKHAQRKIQCEERNRLTQTETNKQTNEETHDKETQTNKQA